MNGRNPFFLCNPSPVCMGTGLVALDIVIDGSNEGKASLWTGGSCGNVLTILAYLGWSSYPIANYKEDCASETILKDLARWGVNSEYIFRSKNGSTPIVIERLWCDKDKSTHQFQFICPVCGAHLPRSRPVSLKIVSQIERNMPSARIFYFDRVSKSSVTLAKQQRMKGALVIFEPAILSQEQLFKQSLEIAHIVKYSRSQIDISQFKADIPLEIQTLGAKGVRYRSHSSKRSMDEWREMAAFNVSGVVDSAGAGDWCTAGIIHSMGQNGVEGFMSASEKELENALLFGEA